MFRPDSPLSRRRLLVGSALVGGSALGFGSLAFATDTLPASITSARTRRAEIPTIPPRIEIPAAHVEAARSHVERLTTEAERAWGRADASTLGSTDRYVLEDGPKQARNALDEVSKGSGTLRTLEKFQYAAGAAAKTLGAAQYLNGEYHEENPGTEQADLRFGIESLRERIALECDDPSEFLVRVGRGEHHLQQASGFFRRVSPPEDAMDAGGVRQSLASARRDWDDGRRIYRRYRDGLDSPRSFGESLRRNRQMLRRQAEELRDSRTEDASEELSEGSYRGVRVRIFVHGFRFGRNLLDDAERHREDGFEVLSAVETADALRHLLAWRDATARTPTRRKRRWGRNSSFARNAGRSANSATRSPRATATPSPANCSKPRGDESNPATIRSKARSTRPTPAISSGGRTRNTPERRLGDSPGAKPPRFGRSHPRTRSPVVRDRAKRTPSRRGGPDAPRPRTRRAGCGAA